RKQREWRGPPLAVPAAECRARRQRRRWPQSPRETAHLPTSPRLRGRSPTRRVPEKRRTEPPPPKLEWSKSPSPHRLPAFFLTFRVHPGPYFSPRVRGKPGRGGAGQQRRTTIPKPPDDGCESPGCQLGTHNS